MNDIVMSLGIVGGICLLLFIWLFPKWQAGRNIPTAEKWKAENEFRKTLIQGAGGLLVIASLFFTWTQLGNTQANFYSEYSQTQKSHRLTQFTQAIKFLSENNSIQRIGSIYTLEQIAKEAPNEYMETVVNVLAAFVRNTNGINDEQEYSTVSNDVQIAMMVLGRVRGDNSNPLIDLGNGIICPGRKLNKSNFVLANFVGADFQQVDFSDSELKGAVFRGAILDKAIFKNAQLQKADFSGDTELQYADFTGAQLQEAQLCNAALSCADLRNAQLNNADLRGARLNYAKLKGANFSGADLRRVDFSEAIGLSAEQLMVARTLFEAKDIPTEIERKLKQQKPELFTKPDKKERRKKEA